jgi:hypothetical protein
MKDLKENMKRFGTKNLKEQFGLQQQQEPKQLKSDQLNDLLSLMATMPMVGNAAQLTKIIKKSVQDRKLDNELGMMILGLFPIIGDPIKTIKAIQVIQDKLR